MDDAADATTESPNNWPVWTERALQSLRAGLTNSRAAARAGVDRTTMWRLTQRDEAFALAAADARLEGAESLIDTATMRAREGQPWEETVETIAPDGTRTIRTKKGVHLSDNLLMFRIKKEFPEYRDSYRVEQSGPGGGPIQVETKVTDAVGYFDAEVVRLAADGSQGEAPGDNGGSGGHLR